MTRFRRILAILLICSVTFTMGGYFDWDGGGAPAYGANDTEAGITEETNEAEDADIAEEQNTDGDESDAIEDETDPSEDGSQGEDAPAEETDVETGEPAQDIDAEETAEDTPAFAWREVKAEVVSEPIYEYHNKKKYSTAACQGLTDFWGALMGRDAAVSEDAPKLKVTVGGELPEDVTAEARVMGFDEAAAFAEQGLASVDLILYDGTGDLYVPETPVTVTVSGSPVKREIEDGNAPVVYVYRETPKRAADYAGKYGKSFFAANVSVFKSESVNDKLLNYEVYDKEKEYKAGEDAVRFSNAKAGLTLDEDAVSFEYSYKADKRLVLTTQMAERTLSQRTGEAVVSVRGPLDREVNVEVSEITKKNRDYRSYVDQAAGALGTEASELLFAKAYDISLIDPKTGEKFQPDRDVKVSIKLQKEDLTEAGEISVVHFPQTDVNAEADGIDGSMTGQRAGSTGSGQAAGNAASRDAGSMEESEDAGSMGSDQDAGSMGSGQGDDSASDQNAAGTDPEVLDCKVKGNTVRFDTDGFSVYVLAAAGIGENAVRTGNENNAYITKELTGFQGNLATYKIQVNNEGNVINEGNPLTLKDIFNDQQSILYSSIDVQAAGQDYSYDYSGNTGTYTIPDGVPVTIEYRTRVKGGVGVSQEISNTAVLSKTENDEAETLGSASVKETKTISPTGTDTSGQSGVYTIDLFAYPQNHMEEGLEGAVFRMLDSNMRPITYRAGDRAGEAVTFITDDKGHATIKLDKDDHGLTIRKNTVYYLEMVTAPYQIKDGKYIYYQKDSTYYSFLITDDPNYTFGGVYSYFNGDTLKVRCYPEGPGVNVTKRFSGNYELTEEQKNAITFTLQKEKPGTAEGWENVESHRYADFRYGSLNFNIGKDGGEELEDNATYRVIEEHSLPAELEDIVDEDVSVSVSYQENGKPVEDDSNEFFVDPDDKLASSYDFTFTNNYVDHKLTIVKINENTGEVLKDVEFDVYGEDGTGPVATYVTDSSGSITIRKSDEGAGYTEGKLYYVVEKKAPSGYILPEENQREKTYFYFSGDDDTVPGGLPSGATATDLTKSYDTVTIANESEKVDVPVTVVWGRDGKESWPDNVKQIVVGLYKSVDGNAAVPVTQKDGLLSSSEPCTLILTKDKQYDIFKELDAIEDGKTVEYSVVEEKITDSSDSDITDQYASATSISGTGWHVIRNQAALSVRVEKKWFEQNDDTPVSGSDLSGKPQVSFDLYRTTRENDKIEFTRAELTEFLSTAERVRTGLKLNAGNNWRMDVKSLQVTDKDGHPYYYYALEDIPANQEDSYTVTAATESDPRVLTIKNTQTPVTVNIKAGNLEKAYGDKDPTYEIDASVMDDGSSVSVTGPGEDGMYAATVTDSNGEEKTLSFKVIREAGENVGTYAITPVGDALQKGYRVLFEPGKLDIRRAEVTITAGASKVYGDNDPSLVSIVGLKNDEEADDVLEFDVSREEGEDIGEYAISLTGEKEQGNYTVDYVVKDEHGKPSVLTINRASVTVKADDKDKTYGEDDPGFTATVTGLKNDDEPSVITYDLTRAPGEDVGEYEITPSADTNIQGNYEVVFMTGKLVIKPAGLTVKVKNAEKTYGEEDPEWEIVIEGLRDEDEGTLIWTRDESTGARTYSYSVGEETEPLLSFTAAREAGEDVGDYTIHLTGESKQGNYDGIEYKNGVLNITRAELIVTADHIVKAAGIEEDPLLTATVTGWKNGDDDYMPPVHTNESGKITWTYSRESGGKTVQLLTFTLERDPGQSEGEYTITASGDREQSNYDVSYEAGIFGILSVLDIDVTQPLIDDADADADPSYTYTARLDLAGTGLNEYNKNEFEEKNGVPTLEFTLPDGNKENRKTLKVPGGAKVTVTQDSSNEDYTTSVSCDGNPIATPGEQFNCTIDEANTYHEIAFTHSRISLPVEARAAAGQDESEAVVLDGRKGAMGIPQGEEGVREINAGFADEMHSKIGYALPTDRYYVYDHTSLYKPDGTALAGASGVEKIRYDRENSKWQYSVGGNFIDVPEGSRVVMFYLPKFVCKIEGNKFYSLKAAVEYAVRNEKKNVTIEMLIDDYSIRNASDAVTIPKDYSVTITTPGVLDPDYEGKKRPASISRSMNYTNGYLFINNGSLTFDKITLDGKGIVADTAMINNAAANASLTVDENALIKDARGVNGGAIYVTNGTVDVKGRLQGNNASAKGGAVYMANGTMSIASGADIVSNTAKSGGVVFMANGTISITGCIGKEHQDANSANHAEDGGAVYMTGGTLRVVKNGSIGNNTADHGGAVYMTGGTATLNGTIGNNTAEHGGAVYMTGGSLTADDNGIINSNTAEHGGAVYQSGGTLTVGNNGSICGNTAAKGGGIYLAGGTFLLNGGAVSQNEAVGDAADGGAIYGTNGTITLSSGEMKNNNATGDGGAICSINANVNVNGGTVSNNTGLNGGAIYTANAAVNLTGGSVSQNKATAGGGAVYMGSGTVSLSGGMVTNNEASNGSAIFVDSGIGNIASKITGNTASNGGAVGVGSTSACLYFTGNASVSGNTMNGAESNVYLDMDSDKVINANADTLKAENKIGIYVPDGANEAQVKKHGDVGGYFGAYSTNQNVNDTNVKFPVLESIFVNDRFNELDSKYENNRLYWGAKLTYDVVYKDAFDSEEPPKGNASYNGNTAGQYRAIALNKTCYPHGEDGNEYQVYDLVNGLDLYNSNSSNFDSRGAGAASVYAYTYANSRPNKFDSNLRFADFLKAVRWDTGSRKWQFVKQDGTTANVDSGNCRIVIIYSAPAYISITNNNEKGLPLKLELKVNGRNAGETHYGYATARNGATVQNLMPLTDHDLTLQAGESVKMLFPGAAGKPYTLNGTFEGAEDSTAIPYTINGGSPQTNTGKTVSITGRNLPSGYSTEEIVFGDALPICKIGNETFPTLNAAVDYMKGQQGIEFTVEMLVDYLIPSADVLNIPSGYKVTFTTSQDDDFRGSHKGKNGEPNKAILSRDFGNMSSSVSLTGTKNSGSTLNVTNLEFDGRAIAGTGNGGAISTMYCDVTIDNCEFKGYQATRGGAIYVVRGGADDQQAKKDPDSGEPVGGLKITNSIFENCKSSAKVDKAGGGAVWTTAKGLVMKNCILTDCACTDGSAQGGAVFHNIVDGKNLGFIPDNYESGYSKDTMTLLEDLTFNGCYSIAGAGGAIETDAQDTVIRRSKFYSCYTNSKGGGGAIIVYARDQAQPNASWPCTMTASDCEFYNSRAEGVSDSTWGGGAIRTTTRDTTITNCIFDGASTSKHGGAVCVTNSNATSLTIEGGSFKDCIAMGGNGGAVYYPGSNLSINGKPSDTANTSFTNCTAQNNGGGLSSTKEGGSATVKNAVFSSCIARTGNGGGLYAVAKNLSVTGGNTKFSDCTAQNEGGGIYHDKNPDGGSATFGGMYENCAALTGNGGAIRSISKTMVLDSCTVKDSHAVNCGGGVYAGTSTVIKNGTEVTGCYVTGSDGRGGGIFLNDGTSRFINGTIKDCSATSGGGVYFNKATLYILSGEISGSAINGGGLYQNDGNSKIYHYGGTITGTAAYNGGGIYKKSGTYTLGNGTLDGIEYTGASIGTVKTEGVEEPVYTATAVNDGGAFYNNDGTLNLNTGSMISGKATGNGGGVWSKKSINQNDGMIIGLAANGGGVYHAGVDGNAKYTISGGEVSGTAAKDGGAVYLASGAVELKNNGCVSDGKAANGGGLYMSGGTVNMNNNSTIKSSKASQNGGGVYVAGGTYNFNGGTIKENRSDVNGGGVYYAQGAFNMTGNTASKYISDNTADKGAGVYVADGLTMKIDTWGNYFNEIRYNHALTEGGGIAVGGANAVLSFKNKIILNDNTMGDARTECNVYLNYDSNTIIKNDSLNTASYIGVYASDDQMNMHGLPGRHFATRSSDSGLEVYHNDRSPYLCGTKGTGNLVDWANFNCKITDGEGKLLYKNASGDPAVYLTLENIGATGAFSELNKQDTPALYTREGELYSGSEYQVQMLVPEYILGNGRQIKLDKNATRKVTLTTASTEEDECGFKYTGDPRFAATIKRQTNTWAMVFIGGNNKWELILRNITMDGGNNTAQEEGGIVRMQSNGAAILDEGATLMNMNTNNKSGGAVYVTSSGNTFTMNPGSKIIECHAGTASGGGVGINDGTFIMNGGEITACTANNGGGVWMNNASVVNMKGGKITGNYATTNGGGIALSTNSGNSRIHFTGLCMVTGNLLNSTVSCNVQLNQNNNQIINANGLDGRSEIGIYTGDAGNIYRDHGGSGDPFGTWSVQDDKLFCFINDRSTNLRGFQSADTSDTKIYWEYHPLLTVTKDVNSDLAYDMNEAEFTFKIELVGEDLHLNTHNKFGDLDFNNQGIATVKLKAGKSATAVLPDNFDKVQYKVTEIPEQGQTEKYTTTAEKDGVSYPFVESEPLTVTGQLGENIGKEISTSLSEVVFTNSRVAGNLVISKRVESENAVDLSEEFSFKLSFADKSINGQYDTSLTQSESDEITGKLTVVNGEASFKLMHGQSLNITGLPTDLQYTVKEVLTEKQRSLVRTKVSKDGGEESYAESLEGRIGENIITEGDRSYYESNASFINNFLAIVCKITNRSRELLYYKETGSNLQPAIYSHLEDAFDQINRGNLRTSGGGTVSGLLRVEMIVPEYTMGKGATLNNGKTILLSTALTTDEEYPYNGGDDDGKGNVSTVIRGFREGSMITDKGALTIDKIILDGASGDEDAPISADTSGGIVNVADNVKLIVNSSAKLRNSTVNGNGGAISLIRGSSLDMDGLIENCSAKSGGGIYAEKGFAIIKTTGTISGCQAADDGGAICASSEGTSLNINAGTILKGNTAGKNGGAVYSASNVILRGAVGGTAEGYSNAAAKEGGGFYMDKSTTFTMYSGSEISGNRAVNGGGIAAYGTTRIPGGSLKSNTALAGETQLSEYGRGGAVYAAEGADVTVSDSALFKDNTATWGGAIYDADVVTMKGGSVTDNTASEAGGAVYVAEKKTFNMTNGSIAGNKSPEGAVSTEKDALLVFSGNVVVRSNTGLDGTTTMNVHLGYDSNSIITTNGLGKEAEVGVYVADGEPEGDIDKPIYYEHGLSARNFGTYTGSSINSARLNNFVNDRDTTLTGVNGGKIGTGTQYYVAWNGKGLELKVQESETGTKGTPIDGVTLVLKNEEGKQVWSGKSKDGGSIVIPWTGDEKENGNGARFAPESTYTLEESETSGKAVRPAGTWTLLVGKDDSLTWNSVSLKESYVNRTINIVPMDPKDEKAYLGDVFILYNDVKPTITYDATGGKLSDKTGKRTDTIGFTTRETKHSYLITEANPYWDSHVFKGWATMKEKPEGIDANDAEALAEKGYFVYKRTDDITFYRGTEDDRNTQGTAKGDLTLYAQWEAVVCKITDREGTLLFVDGSPAVYGTLEDGFEVYNTETSFKYQNGKKATPRNIEMLVGDYTLKEAVHVARKKTVVLTTASKDDNDGYAYTGTGPICVIKRGADCNTSMITNYANLTLTNITLDGCKRSVDCSGGIVNNGSIGENAVKSAILTISTGATLRNSNVNGKGGAVYVGSGNTLYIYDGTINGNRATEGAGIYLGEDSSMMVSGKPYFGGTGVMEKTDSARLTMFYDSGEPAGNFTAQNDYNKDTQNGGLEYPKDDGKYYARQDIFIAGYSGDDGITNAASLGVAGSLNVDNGTIWVWAEQSPHYKSNQQFAKNRTRASTLDVTAFRNAKDDETTENNTGEYLTAELIVDDGDRSNIFWTGSKGVRKVILRKVDSSYTSAPGKTFTVYKGTSSEAYTPKSGNPLIGLTSGNSGCFWVGELPYGWYIVEETNPRKFFYIVVAASGTYGTLDTDDKNKIGGYENRADAQNAAEGKFNKLK